MATLEESSQTGCRQVKNFIYTTLFAGKIEHGVLVMLVMISYSHHTRTLVCKFGKNDEPRTLCKL